MKYFSKKTLAFSWVLIFFGGAAFSQDGMFKRVHLSHGISIEVPSHWVTLPSEIKMNLNAAGASMMDNSGVGASKGQKITLLAMNAVPEPTGAMIRLSVKSSPSYSQADLAAVTADDLKEVGLDFYNTIKQLEASGSLKVVEVQPVRVDKINGRLSLVLSYIRESKVGALNWQEVQYKIPTSKYLIEMTLSHRQSDAIVWAPILEKVRRSVQFKEQ